MARVIVPHDQALQALAIMVGWNGGWLPVYSYRQGVPGGGPGGARMSWLPARQAQRWIAEHVRRGDEQHSDEIEIGLPEFRRWNGGVGGATVLWARITGSDQLRRARAFRPLPSLVVQEGSSSQRWLVWSLSEHVRYAALGDANRRISYALRATQKHGDPDAFRLPAPGSCLRRDRKKAVPVVCSRLDVASYTVVQVVGRLKEPPPKDSWLGVQR